MVHFKEDDNLGLTPINLELLPLRFPLATDLFHNRSYPGPAAIHLDCDILARPLIARRQIVGAEPHQVTGAGGQDLRPQFTGNSPDRLLVQFLSLAGQLRAGLFDWQETDQTAYLGLDIGTAPLADLVSRQFRVEPTALATASLSGAHAR